jgi:hypothetical protein
LVKAVVKYGSEAWSCGETDRNRIRNENFINTVKKTETLKIKVENNIVEYVSSDGLQQN